MYSSQTPQGFCFIEKQTQIKLCTFSYIYINIMVDVAQCFRYIWHPRFFRSSLFSRLRVFVSILTDLLLLLFSYSTVTVSGDGLDSNLRYYEHYIDKLLRSAFGLNLTTNRQAVPWSRQTKQYLHFPKALHAMVLDYWSKWTTSPSPLPYLLLYNISLLLHSEDWKIKALWLEKSLNLFSNIPQNFCYVSAEFEL
jgi:hypothetical protein